MLTKIYSTDDYSSLEVVEGENRALLSIGIDCFGGQGADLLGRMAEYFHQVEELTEETVWDAWSLTLGWEGKDA